MFEPTQQQAVIRDVLMGTSYNLQIRARAGTGKTATTVWLCEQLQKSNPYLSILSLAFNRDIKDELQQRMPRGIKVYTFHGLGLMTCKQALGDVKIDQYKLHNYIRACTKTMAPATALSVEKDIKNSIGIIYATLTDPNDCDKMLRVLRHYDKTLECPEISIALLSQIIQQKRQDQTAIDYDDMQDYPLIFGYRFPQYDYVFVDEAQDVNASQRETLRRLLKPNGRLIAVGDDRQAIYRFRGADGYAMDTLQKQFNMAVYPLSITFRCPKAVVEKARHIVPDYQAHPSAPAGKVLDMCDFDVHRTISALNPGDMVLCRINAPLVPHCLSLARQGKKAWVRGRDIGGGLIALCRRFSKKSIMIADILPEIDIFLQSQIDTARRAGDERQAQTLTDKWDTLYALAQGLASVPELETRINAVFSDRDKGAVLFSTVHKAKGLEAPTVVVLKPELMPPPWVKDCNDTALAMQEEENIRYVAYTRAQETLILQPDSTEVPRQRLEGHRLNA